MSDLHPEFENRLRAFLIATSREGWDVGITQGFRSFEEQNKLFVKRPKVTNAKGGLSWHNYGLAADVCFKDEKGRFSWAEKWPWKKLGEVGKKCGLEWGGDWKNPDRPHFQYTTGLGIRTALRLYQQGGIGRVWQEIDAGGK